MSDPKIIDYPKDRTILASEFKKMAKEPIFTNSVSQVKAFLEGKITVSIDVYKYNDKYVVSFCKKSQYFKQNGSCGKGLRGAIKYDTPEEANEAAKKHYDRMNVIPEKFFFKLNLYQEKKEAKP